MKRFFCCVVLFLSLVITAEDEQMNIPNFPAGAGGLGEIIKTVREKYPEDFARIMQLRQTDPAAAMQQGIELARKAGVALPDFSGLPTANVHQEQQATQVQSEQKLFVRDFRKENMQKAEEAIKAAYPEDFAKLEELRKTDPEEARYFFTELASRIPGLIIKGKQQVPDNITQPNVQDMERRNSGEFSGGMPPAFNGRSNRRGNFPSPGGMMQPEGRRPRRSPNTVEQQDVTAIQQ